MVLVVCSSKMGAKWKASGDPTNWCLPSTERRVHAAFCPMPVPRGPRRWNEPSLTPNTLLNWPRKRQKSPYLGYHSLFLYLFCIKDMLDNVMFLISNPPNRQETRFKYHSVDIVCAEISVQ